MTQYDSKSQKKVLKRLIITQRDLEWLKVRVRRVALTPFYTRLTAAAGDPPNTNIFLREYQATSENLLELSIGKRAKTKAKKFSKFGFNFELLEINSGVGMLV